jgi:Tetratricopeptide repeat
MGSVNGLASTYKSAGRVDHATTMHEQNLARQRDVLGDNHPDTMTSVNNLANAYWSAGRVGEAIILFEQNLARQRDVHGDNHPDTMTSVNNLANVYRSVGRVSHANSLVDTRKRPTPIKARPAYLPTDIQTGHGSIEKNPMANLLRRLIAAVKSKAHI